MTVNDRIRREVRDLMRERGLSQQDLADMTGIERPNINAMLNGKIGKMPERWERVLKALGKDVGLVDPDATAIMREVLARAVPAAPTSLDEAERRIHAALDAEDDAEFETALTAFFEELAQ